MATNKSAKKAGTILIVEDDTGLQKQLRWSFEDYEVALANDQKSALDQLAKINPQVVLLDLGLPPDPDGPSAGLTVLQEVLKEAPTAKVIIMSGQTDRAYALKAIALGAYDFYQKPIKVEEIQLIVSRALQLHQLEAENRQLASARGGEALPGFVTTHPELLLLCDELRRLAATDITGLITGESGTGKEVLAQALHDLSPRRKGPLVAVNCAAIPETLLESELFGHEKGAFTGAIKQTIGKVEQAEGGTFFLDEVGDMPVALQAKLLRFLQERKVERVGGRSSIPVDVRVVAATNQSLENMIAEGRFRQDFYYRLSESEFYLPPLRERPEDAVLIAHRLVREYAKQLRRPVRGFSSDALAAILAHNWPGNVRELQNCIKRAIASSRGSNLTSQDLRLELEEGHTDTVMDLATVRMAAESRALRRAQAVANGNRSEMARLLGISRPTLYQMLKQHSLDQEATQEEGGSA
jgi:two-component system NtrC family response regulator